MEQPSSNLFEGYKAVGHVTGPRPFIVRHGRRPQDTRILTIVNRTFHTYNTKLSLLEVSIPHEHDIKVLTSDERLVYSACGRSVFGWARGSKKLEHRLDNGHQAEVEFMIKLDSDRLVSVDKDNVLFVWNIAEQEVLNIISFDEDNCRISALCHPLNYNDKILVATKQGALQLWNVKTEQCLYKYDGWQSGVTCLAQSPAEDVVAIGLEDGHVYIHNIKYDEVVMKIYQEYGPVTSMSFRLDGKPYLVTGSELGHLMIWNLDTRRLSSQIRDAHAGSISNCQFLRNESMLVTSGSDNSLKVWALDMLDGGGNLLCQRAGHSEPPTCIRFYGSKGFNLLSAGGDSTLKMFHMYSERLNRNLGTARENPRSHHKNAASVKKLPPITQFAAESAREKQWDNIVACHRDASYVTTWNYDKCKMGEHFISQPTFGKHQVNATCVCLTSCGNHLIIGFSNGLIFRYNIQSGLFRQTYEDEEAQLSEHRAHDGPVSGLVVDCLNVVLISGGQDCSIKVWHFKTGKILLKTTCSAPITRLELHKENNLLAIATQDDVIEIMDLVTRNLVRRFEVKSKILDLTFSPDCRWLIVASDDAAIRTWDLSLGKMIDAFRLKSACISLSISSTGEFLATAHRDSLGINIWSNYTIYCATALRVIDQEKTPPLLDMPFVRSDDVDDNETSETQDVPVLEAEARAEYISPDQLHEGLITLSGLPASRWKNLLNIEELRAKQLIKEEEKRAKPIKVPFFIPVQDGLQPKLDAAALKKQHAEQAEQDALNLQSKIRDLSLLSPLAQCLIDCAETGCYLQFLHELKQLGPSATDAEIRSLGADTCGHNKVALSFLDAMQFGLTQRKDYELFSSWLALFLKAHSDAIQTDRELQAKCANLMPLVSTNWDRLNEQFNRIFCVLNFVRSSIL